MERWDLVYAAARRKLLDVLAAELAAYAVVDIGTVFIDACVYDRPDIAKTVYGFGVHLDEASYDPYIADIMFHALEQKNQLFEMILNTGGKKILTNHNRNSLNRYSDHRHALDDVNLTDILIYAAFRSKQVNRAALHVQHINGASYYNALRTAITVGELKVCQAIIASIDEPTRKDILTCNSLCRAISDSADEDIDYCIAHLLPVVPEIAGRLIIALCELQIRDLDSRVIRNYTPGLVYAKRVAAIYPNAVTYPVMRLVGLLDMCDNHYTAGAELIRWFHATYAPDCHILGADDNDTLLDEMAHGDTRRVLRQLCALTTIVNAAPQ